MIALRSVRRNPEFAVGRIENGTVRDAVVFNVGPAASVSPSDTSDTPVTVFGESATLTEGVGIGGANRTVVWGDDPMFVAVGADPLALLDAVAADTFVLTDPQAVGMPGTLIGLLQIGDNELNVSTRDSLGNMALAGIVTQVDVNGTVGWTFPDEINTHDVAWQVDEDTFAYPKINDGSSVDDVLAIARSAEFVAAGEWMTRYDVGLPAPL